MTPGIWQILLIVLIVFLIFGAGKLPNVMGDLAKGVRNFKKGLQDEADQPEKGAITDQSKDKNAASSPSKTTAKDNADV